MMLRLWECLNGFRILRRQAKGTIHTSQLYPGHSEDRLGLRAICIMTVRSTPQSEASLTVFCKLFLCLLPSSCLKVVCGIV